MALPSTGRFLWLKADTLALANGALVAAWTDSSGTGNNAAQGTTGARPAFVTNAVAGKPAVRFANGKSLLTPSIPAKSALTILMYLVSSNSAAGYLVLATDGSHGIIQGYTGGKYEYFSSPRTVIGDISTTNYQFIYSRVGTSTEGAWSIGLDTAFDLAEIVAYDRVLTNQEIQDAADYFAARYTPDDTPPSKVAGLTVDANRVVTSQVASDNVGVAGYQTQYRDDGGAWTNFVSDQQTFTDTVPYLTATGDHTRDYRRRAYDAAGNYGEWSDVFTVNYTVLPAPEITDSSPLPPAQIGKSYQYQFHISGGSGSFDLAAQGNLPNNAVGSAGLLTIPTVGNAAYTFTLRWTGTDGRVATKEFTIPVSPYAYRELCYQRPLKRTPVVTATEFKTLSKTYVVEDAPLKYEYELTLTAIGQDAVKDLEHFFEDHRLKEPFYFYNADWDETRLVYLDSGFPSERMLNYGGVQVTLKDV